MRQRVPDARIRAGRGTVPWPARRAGGNPPDEESGARDTPF